MQIFVKFFSTVSGKSVIIAVGNRKYAFNMFEGFQRYCIETALSLCSLDVVFLPNEAGIPALIGAYLTMGGIDDRRPLLVTRADVDWQAIKAFARGIVMPNEQLTDYTDEYISVETHCDAGPANYLVEFARIPGEFYPEKVPAEIPKGLYKALSKRESVTVGGVVYHGRDYSAPSVRPDSFALVFSTEGFEEFPETFLKADRMVCMNERAYQFFYLRKKEGVVHRLMDPVTVDYTGQYDALLKLQQLDKNCLVPLVPRLLENQSAIKGRASTGITRGSPSGDATGNACSYSSIDCDNNMLISTRDSMVFNKKNGFTTKKVPFQEIKEARNCTSIPGMVFLGTGCMIPTKYRSTSCILYETEDSAALIDCGEDSYSQILRLYGNDCVLEKLDLIYLSHSHADHTLGIAKVLQHARRQVTIVGPKACRSYIETYATPQSPGSPTAFPHHYIETDGAKLLEHAFYSANPEWATRSWLNLPKSDIAEFINTINLNAHSITLAVKDFSLQICGCLHSDDSTSLLLKHRSTATSLAYSGDSSPSVLFTSMANGADILVHEATFRDDEAVHACHTNHTTIEDARAVAVHSKSKKLFLTHFSNRNPEFTTENDSVVDFYHYSF